jgi:hypothetical protein
VILKPYLQPRFHAESNTKEFSAMTWLGHCVVNIRTVLQSLPSAGQLMLISDLREFLDREERDIRRRNYASAISMSSRHQNVDFRRSHRYRLDQN